MGAPAVVVSRIEGSSEDELLNLVLRLYAETPPVLWKGVARHGRYLREAGRSRRNCGMVDHTGRRHPSRSPMDLVPRLYVFASRMAALALGTGFKLAVRPDCLVLVSRALQGIPVVAGGNCPLVAVLVEEITKANASAVIARIQSMQGCRAVGGVRGGG